MQIYRWNVCCVWVVSLQCELKCHFWHVKPGNIMIFFFPFCCEPWVRSKPCKILRNELLKLLIITWFWLKNWHDENPIKWFSRFWILRYFRARKKEGNQTNCQKPCCNTYPSLTLTAKNFGRKKFGRFLTLISDKMLNNFGRH